jgi:hypothetical protein
MDPQRRRPIVRVVKNGSKVRPRRPIAEWIQAWQIVMRDPDKTMPDATIPPEGQPIPPELNLHCPECGRNLGGLTDWICPSCGEPFNPIRTYTLQMMEQPEYFLRYRLDPSDIRRTLLGLVLVVAGFALVLVATLVALIRGQGNHMLPISVAWASMSVFLGLSVPITAVLYLGMEVALPRILFFFSVPWFLMCLVLFIVAFL